MADILEKIKAAQLVGRGGAAFPTHIKWSAVKEEKSDKKYVICNASEKEMAVFKDIHILENFPEKLFEGIRLALDFVGTDTCYFNFNKEYYERVKDKIDPLIADFKEKGYSINIYEEEPSYIGGEETALLNAIEGKRLQPRLKPPYPTQAGLYGKPTLIHNVETLYNVACVEDGTFEGKRFYSVSGAVKNEGVFHLPADLTVLQVLEETDNVPDFEYFVQAGGGASGEVLRQDQIADQPVGGTGSVKVYRADIDPKELLMQWLDFYNVESCGKCTPCREGTYQLFMMVKENDEIPWDRMQEIMDVLAETSFCALGKSVPVPIRSYMKNVLKL